MPFDAHDPTVEPKLSEISKPFEPDMDASCFWKSGDETPLTVIRSWLALKAETTFSRASPSGPLHRYEKLTVTFSAGADAGAVEAAGPEAVELVADELLLELHAAAARTTVAMTAHRVARLAVSKLGPSSANGVLW